MAISIEELKKLLISNRQKLHRMELAEEYEKNVETEGKYFRYINNEAYDPWPTFIKVFAVHKKSSNRAYVISFEKDLKGQCIFQPKYFRKIQILGEEITKDEFDEEYEKFNVTLKHFSVNVRL